MDLLFKHRWLAAAFGVSLLAFGLPFWSLSYQQAQRWSSLMELGVIVTALAACGLRLLNLERSWRIVLVVGSAVPLADIARVFMDTARDPTSHNLWPFEVVMMAFIGYFWAGVGTLVGKAGARAAAQDPQGHDETMEMTRPR